MCRLFLCEIIMSYICKIMTFIYIKKLLKKLLTKFRMKNYLLYLGPLVLKRFRIYYIKTNK